ncbi:MAG: septum formation initiator family protein [Rhodospirillales bacterium]|nr:septum formation initiator family protein [Rhodospirillales bacterium]
MIGICAIAYFGFHVVHGERGLLTYWRLKQMIAETQPVLDEARVQRKMLENRVSLLRPDNLDPDMLEERARVMLNFGYANDLIILYAKETNQ